MNKQIESALLAANGSRAGSAVPKQAKDVHRHLCDAGLMTYRGNLTAKGAQMRDQIAKRREDEAFG